MTASKVRQKQMSTCLSDQNSTTAPYAPLQQLSNLPDDSSNKTSCSTASTSNSDMPGLFSNATISGCTLNIAINMYRSNVEDSVAVTPAIKKRRLIFDDNSDTD